MASFAALIKGRQLSSSILVIPRLLVFKQSLFSGNINSGFLTYSQVASKLSVEDSFVKRLKSKFIKSSRTKKAAVSASLLYEVCADGVEHVKLFHLFGLPDTFNSWFLLVQLHVWMLMARFGDEDFARPMRNKLTESMWVDVETRMKKIGVVGVKEKNKTLETLSQQFRAAVIAYDEGLYGSDMALAASVWRTMYGFHCNDPRQLETAVLYIRKQMSHLDSQDTETVLYSGKATWLPLNNIVSETKLL